MGKREGLRNLLLIEFLALFTGSCATLNISDISNPDRGFEPLRLEPAIETNDLRIDLVRHTSDVQINDSTTETHDTPYHPLGFNLGNGMFYDLNGNLSFRLDELLGIRENDCWSLEQTMRKRQKRADYVYSFCDNILDISYPPGRRKHYQYHRITEDNTTSVLFRNRLLYAVEFNDKTVVYRGKRRKWDTLVNKGENRYYRKMGWWRENFSLMDGTLYLDRDYFIELSEGNRKIRIIRPGFLINRPLLTLSRTGQNLYIYDRRLAGTRIEFTEEGLNVYRNRTFIEGWKIRQSME
jgi:hypothetical protein